MADTNLHAATSLPDTQTVAEEKSVSVQETASAQTQTDGVEDPSGAKDDGLAKHAEGKTAGPEAASSTNGANGTEAQDSTKDRAKNPHRNDKHGNRGRGGMRNRGNRSNLTAQGESDDPVAIRKQVEFYFSDANLATDKYLWTQTEGAKNMPVEISILHSFKRMRHFQPFTAVVDALKGSDFLEVVEGDRVKRKTALPKDFENKSREEVQKVVEDEAMARSVYVKGFGFEHPSTQFDIEAFFTPYGQTNQVRLRRADDQSFKGSVFVEFASEEFAKKFLALDPMPKFKDRNLTVKSKKQYCDEKVEDIRAGRVRPANSDDRPGSRRGNHRDQKGRGKEDGRDWRERRKEEQENGFADDRGDRRDRRRGGHRGSGRGGGRGGRNRNEERGAKAKGTTDEQASDVPVATGEAVAAAAPETTTEPSKKRSREEDDVGANEQPTPKTAAVEATPVTDSSKKRERDQEDDGIDGKGSAKKAHTES